MSQKSLDARTLSLILMAGCIGQIAFELYAWTVSPLLFEVTLEPSRLVSAIVAKVFGVDLSYAWAFFVHALIGVLGFAFTILAVRRLLHLGFLLSGALAGLALWFMAQGLLAPFIGRNFMMDFGAYTQSSLVGHVGMTLIIAAVLRSGFSRQGRLNTASLG